MGVERMASSQKGGERGTGVTSPPSVSARPGGDRTILSEPRGCTLNRGVGPIDVPLYLAFTQWTLIWTWVLGPGMGLEFGHGL